MGDNGFLKTSVKRHRLFEIAIVLSIIALIVYIAFQYYGKPVKDSSSAFAEIHSGIFSRMISNIHAMGATDDRRFVSLNSDTFYLNEFGWPSNTNAKMSSSIRNQSAEECRQLWNAIFTNAPSSVIDGATYNKKTDYKISLNKKVICRYELIGKQERSYFLDYDVSNGAVTVVRP